jgi:hypothetical protein
MDKRFAPGDDGTIDEITSRYLSKDQQNTSLLRYLHAQQVEVRALPPRAPPRCALSAALAPVLPSATRCLRARVRERLLSPARSRSPRHGIGRPLRPRPARLTCNRCFRPRPRSATMPAIRLPRPRAQVTSLETETKGAQTAAKALERQLQQAIESDSAPVMDYDGLAQKEAEAAYRIEAQLSELCERTAAITTVMLARAADSTDRPPPVSVATLEEHLKLHEEVSAKLHADWRHKYLASKVARRALPASPPGAAPRRAAPRSRAWASKPVRRRPARPASGEACLGHTLPCARWQRLNSDPPPCAAASPALCAHFAARAPRAPCRCAPRTCSTSGCSPSRRARTSPSTRSTSGS